ncbi:MAG: hypothetical protein ACRC2B_19785 [Rubrivivax sp.]
MFRSYEGRRRRWRLPSWLVLLLGGVAAGAVAVVVVQERYLAPRLSAVASAELRGAFEQAELERMRLRGELAEVSKRLELTLAERKLLSTQLDASRATGERLREDLASVVASLPADRRGGAVEVRAGRFTAKAGVLSYNVVLVRERGGGKSAPGVLQFLVEGASDRGTQTSVALKPIALAAGNHEVVRGSLPLPEGFRPQQTTVQVLDRVAGKSLGMRVILVQ